MLQIRSEVNLRRPDSSEIQDEEYITYLGSAVSADGPLSKELSRRLGMAYGTFRDLARLWRHSALGTQTENPNLQHVSCEQVALRPCCVLAQHKREEKTGRLSESLLAEHLGH